MAKFAEMLFQNAQQEVTKPGLISSIGDGMQSGIQLGLAIEQQQQAKRQLELQKQQLQEKKQESMFKYLELGMTKVPQRARKAYFNNFFTKQAETLGVPVDPVAMDIIVGQMESDPNLAKYITEYQQSVMEGNPNREALQAFAGAIGDPEKATQLAVDMGRIKVGHDEAKARIAETREGRFQTFASGVSNRIDTGFDKIQDAAKGLRISYSGFQRMLKQADAGGDLPSKAEFNSLATGIIRAMGETGPISEGDAERILNEAGIGGKWEEFKSNWITGEVSKDKLTRLNRLAELAGVELERIRKEKVAQVRSNFNMYPGRKGELESITGLNAMEEPILPPKKQEGIDTEFKTQLKDRYNELAGDKDKSKVDRFLNAAARKMQVEVEWLKKELGITDGKPNKRK